MINVGIINIGISNIKSIYSAIDFLGYNVKLISKEKDFQSVSHLILPGVGSFPSAMQGLKNSNLLDSIGSYNKAGKYILGICLGMQILSDLGYENGITKCAIEKSYNKGAIDFKKPISCHLFPIRISEYKDFDALNYEEIKICEPACDCGSKLKVPLYIFLKEPLIRKYGKNWYDKLLEVVSLLNN